MISGRILDMVENNGGEIGFRYDSFILICLRLGVLLVIIQLITLILNFQSLPHEVPLFYSLPWGEKRLADVKLLFILPLLSFIVLVINSLVAKKLYDKERLLSRISLFIALAFTVLTIITLFQIVLAIT